MSEREAMTLGVVATILLIGLLILKELLLAYAAEEAVKDSWRARLARFYAQNMNVAVLPLLFVFALVVATRVADVL